MDFNVPASIADLLGFNKEQTLVRDKRHLGDNIISIPSLIVMCNIPRLSYLSSCLLSYVHNCVVNSAPGTKIVVSTQNLTIPLVNDGVLEIRVWLVGQSLRPVNICNEIVEVK